MKAIARSSSARLPKQELCRVATEVDDRQGVSDKGSEFRHIILSQLHVFLAVVRLQALHLLPMLLAVDEKNLFPTPCPHLKEFYEHRQLARKRCPSDSRCSSDGIVYLINSRSQYSLPIPPLALAIL